MRLLLRRTGLLLLCLLLLGGCWDYRGLNEQSVVAGIAVDLGEEEQGFRLTFELVDLTGAENGQFGSFLLSTEGESLAEAIYDAYEKLHGNVYLGALDVVIVSRQLAEREGIAPLVDYLIRSPKVRNSLYVAVAASETAAELLTPVEEEEGAGQIISTALAESLRPRRRAARNTIGAPACYEVFKILQTDSSALALPLINTAEADDIPFALEGLALFSGERMSGKLDASDLSLYLLAATGLRDRGFAVDAEGPAGETERVHIVSRSSRPCIRFSQEGGSLRFFLDIHMQAEAVQLPPSWGAADGEMLRRIEVGAKETLEYQLRELIPRLQREGHDILGLAELVRISAPGLWEQIAGDWDLWFSESVMDIQVRVTVQNAGMLSDVSLGMGR